MYVDTSTNPSPIVKLLEKALGSSDISKRTGIIKHMNKIIKIVSGVPDLESTLKILNQYKSRSNKRAMKKYILTQRVIFAIKFSIGVIIGSVIILPLSKLLSQSILISIVVFIIGILALLYNLYLMYNIISLLLKD